MRPLDDIFARAKATPRRIVLPEGEDARVVEGGLRAVRSGLAKVMLLGREAAVRARLAEAGAQDGEIDVIDPLTDSRSAAYATDYLALRRHKGIDESTAAKAMSDPLGFAAMMVRRGDADGTLAGAVATTANTLRTALQIIGRAPGVTTVSSFFLMMLDQPHHVTKGCIVFADCGLIVDPTREELTDIAVSSADSFADLVGEEPRVAMLSFSTSGSARHERVTRVAEATARVRAARPDLKVQGDIQFDAAFVPEVSAAKAPGSTLGGRANVFVFPNLDAANIGYKIAQRIGGAQAFGPILQGLAQPANDLSRGCDADDVYHMIAVTGVQTQNIGEAARAARTEERA